MAMPQNKIRIKYIENTFGFRKMWEKVKFPKKREKIKKKNRKNEKKSEKTVKMKRKKL